MATNLNRVAKRGASCSLPNWQSWRSGLTSACALPSLGASLIGRASVASKKEVRGAVAAAALAATKETYTVEHKLSCRIEAVRNSDECEACQQDP